MKYIIKRHPKQEITQLKKGDINEFLELMELCFIHCIESQSIDYHQVRCTLRKLIKPSYKIRMRFFGNRMNTYLIKVEDKIVSASSLTINRTQGTISNVMTHPEYRRQGFARKLFNHAVEQAHKYNLKQVYLKVHSNNVKAINLYESENFERNYEITSLEIENRIIVLPKHDSNSSINVQVNNSVFMFKKLP